MKNLKTERLKPLAIALLLPQAAGWIGALATASSVKTWYRALNKPRWNPPSQVFGPVWTLLYLLMGTASWLVWRRGSEAARQPKPIRLAGKLYARLRSGTGPERLPPAAVSRKTVHVALGLYSAQLGLNLLWSVIFFGLRRIRLAAVELFLLLGLIVATTYQFFKIDRRAGWLMVPYAAWSVFAAALNSAIWWLNKDSQ
jgi:translocator protein